MTAARLSVLLLVLHTLLTLLPVVLNSAAEDSATNAISKVYSIRSWPFSSCQNPPRQRSADCPFSFTLLYGSSLRPCLTSQPCVWLVINSQSKYYYQAA